MLQCLKQEVLDHWPFHCCEKSVSNDYSVSTRLPSDALQSVLINLSSISFVYLPSFVKFSSILCQEKVENLPRVGVLVANELFSHKIFWRRNNSRNHQTTRKES